MLVLSRKVNQAIVIGRDIRVTLVNVKGRRARLGIDAPSGVPIMRSELAETVKELTEVFGMQEEEPVERLTIVTVESIVRIGDVLVLRVGDEDHVEIRNAREFLAMARNLCEESDQATV